MLIKQIKELDVLNGQGVRTSIWLAGCDHQCEGCFSKHTWAWTGKTPEEINLYETVRRCMEDTRIVRRGISLLGGDPMYWKNRDGLLQFLMWFKTEFPNKDVWLYTGYTRAECEAHPMMNEILQFVDVLVDGRFEEELKDPSLKFRGSCNQNIIYLSGEQ